MLLILPFPFDTWDVGLGCDMTLTEKDEQTLTAYRSEEMAVSTAERTGDFCYWRVG